MTFQLVPVIYWDDPRGPAGHQLSEGEIRLYRQGTYELGPVATAGRPVVIPPGDWVWVAEAPGYVSTFTRSARGDLRLTLEDPRQRATSPPREPDAGLFQGQSGAFFFLEVPAEESLRLALRHPKLRTVAEPVFPEGGSVREVSLGLLRRRAHIEVGVDYRPAREHRSATLELRWCGRERSSAPPAVLIGSCSEPVAGRPLQPGVGSYVFPDLDTGQYLVSADVDGELVPGLGQRVMPFIAPEDDPPAVEVARLEEMHVSGRLLLDDEPVPGVVRLSAWSDDAAVPSRSMETDDDLEYHLHYFARYPTAGEVRHLPQELSDRSPEELPGLYCCHLLSACSDTGACRTFNIHSTFTGEGRFDLELPGESAVEVRALDAATRQPVPGARLLVPASLAFHFVDGDVLWLEPLGIEPDGLDLGSDGEATWLPPGPGVHRLTVTAPEYETASAQAEVPDGGRLTVTLELTRRRVANGTHLLFSDGTPVANAQLLAFDDDGRSDLGCRTVVDGEGFVAPSDSCSERRFLLVHPWAALQVFDGQRIVGSAYVEVRPRPPFPPRVRVVDEDGEPVPGAQVQLRIGDLELTPNDLLAAATAGLPFQTTNALGEIVLHGLDARQLFDVEISPWAPFETDWVELDAARSGPLELVASYAE